MTLFADNTEAAKGTRRIVLVFLSAGAAVVALLFVGIGGCLSGRPAPPIEVVAEGRLQPGESVVIGPARLSSETHALAYRLEAPNGKYSEAQSITFTVTGPQLQETGP